MARLEDLRVGDIVDGEDDTDTVTGVIERLNLYVDYPVRVKTDDGLLIPFKAEDVTLVRFVGGFLKVGTRVMFMKNGLQATGVIIEVDEEDLAVPYRVDEDVTGKTRWFSRSKVRAIPAPLVHVPDNPIKVGDRVHCLDSETDTDGTVIQANASKSYPYLVKLDGSSEERLFTRDELTQIAVNDPVLDINLDGPVLAALEAYATASCNFLSNEAKSDSLTKLDQAIYDRQKYREVLAEAETIRKLYR